jgi:plastocyanin
MSSFDAAAARLRSGGIASRFLLLAGSFALAACGGSGQMSGSSAPACTDGATTPCYSGPPGTEGVGICHGGLRTCSGGAFGACAGEQLPSAETCNGVDEDCNGTPDDGAGAACSSGVCALGACQPPSCTDHVKNGDETGEDCGGATCPACASGLGCALDRDCQSGMCFAAVCQADLNGCTPGAATDLTAQAAVTVTFVGLPTYSYSPDCILVKAGTTVTFSTSAPDSFALHPLTGGAILDGLATPATDGPFVPATSSGTSKDFILSSAGSFPYYCGTHGTIGMNGAIFVVP